MSLRTFTFSMAATLLAGGVVWYLTGPTGGIICLVVGFVLLIIAWLLPKKKKKKRESPIPPQPPISINLSNIGNPVQNQSNRQDARSNILVPRPSEEPQPQRPKANIRFIETRSIHVSESHGVLNGSSQLGDSEACVVCFRNETILGQPAQQPNVRAHIIFRDSDGSEITDASAGVWLGAGKTVVQFTSGDKRCLVIFILGTNGRLFRAWAEKTKVPVAGRPRTVWETSHSELSKPITAVEVHLLADWSGTGLFRVVFDVEPYVNRHLPKLTLRSASAM